MEPVRLERAVVLERLRANRERHRSIFEQAMDGYRARVVEELERRLADIRAGRSVELFIGLEAPQDHTKDYDQIIEMVELQIPDEVTLSHSDFRAFMRDDWQWKRDWVGTTASYVAMAPEDL